MRPFHDRFVLCSVLGMFMFASLQAQGQGLAGPYLHMGGYGSAHRLIAIGDVTGDGQHDFLQADPFWYSPNSYDGLAEVRSGTDGSMVRAHQGGGGEMYGEGACGLGDVNADGRSDYAVTAISTGQTYVYSGMTGQLIYRIFQNQVDTIDVAAADDLNGDGVGDLYILTLVGTQLLVGAFSGTNGARMTTFNAAISVSRQGSSYQRHFLVPVPDTNGDGVGELVVTHPGVAAADRGMLFLLDGRTGALKYSRSGAPRSNLGRAFALIPGFAPNAPAHLAVGDNLGTVHLLNLPKLTTYATLEADAAQPSIARATFGHSIADLGDLNADGISEFAVLQSYYLPASGAPGAAIHLFEDSATKPYRTLELEYPSSMRGPGVILGAEDTNGDGFAELRYADRTFNLVKHLSPFGGQLYGQHPVQSLHIAMNNLGPGSPPYIRGLLSFTGATPGILNVLFANQAIGGINGIVIDWTDLALPPLAFAVDGSGRAVVPPNLILQVYPALAGQRVFIQAIDSAGRLSSGVEWILNLLP